jgi:VIT1/CCC1 family predicted Fe2+/Mn2+ transporter
MSRTTKTRRSIYSSSLLHGSLREVASSSRGDLIMQPTERSIRSGQLPLAPESTIASTVPVVGGGTSIPTMSDCEGSPETSGTDDSSLVRKKSEAVDGRTPSHHPAQEQHLSKSRQYYRDMMLGVNDGLVSTFLLVVGVSGGGMDVTGVLLTAIAGAVAGAISMFAGEFVATKSQNEVMSGEIKLEREHIREYHAEEVQELAHLLTVIGIPDSPIATGKTKSTTNEIDNSTANESEQIRRNMIRYYASNPDALLKIMIALEFGVIDQEVRSPMKAGGASFVSFLLGSLPSVIPFAFVANITIGLIISGLACGLGLLVVGAVKCWATKGNMWLAALENLSITALGSGVAYGIGVGFESLVSEEVPLR